MNTDAKRFYAVLRVDPAASEKAIRLAFRRRAKELHPDSPSGDASAFILLKRAYDTLIDPDHRAAYDLACQPPPRPRPVESRPVDSRPVDHRPPHLYSSPPPPPIRSKSSRRGGVGMVRYVVAFIIMAAISLGGVQAMISLIGGPPSIQTRSTASRADLDPGAAPASSTPAANPSTAPGSSKSGFWDATPATPSKKTP